MIGWASPHIAIDIDLSQVPCAFARAWSDLIQEMGRKPILNREKSLPTFRASPDSVVYRKDGWVGWGDWLGTEATAARWRRQFDPSMKHACSACRLGLTCFAEWVEYCGSVEKGPRHFRVIQVWHTQKPVGTGWGDWLGTGNRRRDVEAISRIFQRCPRLRAGPLGLKSDLTNGVDYLKSGKEA